MPCAVGRHFYSTEKGLLLLLQELPAQKKRV